MEELKQLMKNRESYKFTTDNLTFSSLEREGTNTSDTYDNDIYLVGLDAHIELDTIGSKERDIK